jgi:hypothetical protein
MTAYTSSGARRFGRLLMILVMVLIVFAGFGQAVLHLWNWLMPPIFGLKTITYWQGMGLLALSWIFFGGLRGGGGVRRGWQRAWDRRWDSLTPEEREQFRKAMRGRCATPAAGPETPA